MQLARAKAKKGNASHRATDPLVGQVLVSVIVEGGQDLECSVQYVACSRNFGVVRPGSGVWLYG